jgi:hypothetical protein
VEERRLASVADVAAAEERGPSPAGGRPASQGRSGRPARRSTVIEVPTALRCVP